VQELTAVCQLAAAHAVPTFTHVAYMSRIDPESAAEAYIRLIGYAGATGAHMHICHFNGSSKTEVERSAELVEASPIFRSRWRATTSSRAECWSPVPGTLSAACRDRRRTIAAAGGAVMDGPRHLFWNFVSSSRERIELAKADWKAEWFGKVPGNEKEFIPLPEERLSLRARTQCVSEGSPTS
jgi:pirin-like protein